jgi:hypothetical protein
MSHITNKENVWKLKVGKNDPNYTLPAESLLAKMTDTGNGYIFKFPSHSSVYQDHYVCIDYSEAEYIYLLLKNISGVFDDPAT